MQISNAVEYLSGLISNAEGQRSLIEWVNSPITRNVLQAAAEKHCPVMVYNATDAVKANIELGRVMGAQMMHSDVANPIDMIPAAAKQGRVVSDGPSVVNPMANLRPTYGADSIRAEDLGLIAGSPTTVNVEL